jgi:hypothetical protein
MPFTVTQAQLDRAFAKFYGPVKNKCPKYAFAKPAPICWKPRGCLSPNVFDLRLALLEILKEAHVITVDLKLEDIRLELKDLVFPAIALDVDFSGIARMLSVDFRNSNLGYSIFSSHRNTVKFECCQFPPEGKFINVHSEDAKSEDWVKSPIIQAAMRNSGQRRVDQFFKQTLLPIDTILLELVNKEKGKSQSLGSVFGKAKDAENLAPVSQPCRKRSSEKLLEKAAKKCLKINSLFASHRSASPSSGARLTDSSQPICFGLSR